MSLRRLTVLLPCHSLEDFPTYLRGSEATSLLAAWTALWHPALIAAVGDVPTWRRADDPPDPQALAGELIVVPSSSLGSLPGGWLERIRATHPANPLPITEFDTRAEIIAALVAAGHVAADRADSDVVRDFFALGYCALQMELLSRAMHYPNVIDQAAFAAAVKAASTATTNDDSATIQDRLGACFDLLMQARQRFYPVDSYFLEVTLFSAPTCGAAWRDELAQGVPTNLLASASEIAQLAAAEPATLAALRQAIADDRVTVVGGLVTADSLQTLPPESMLAELVHARDTYTRHLGVPVNVFGQFRSDVSSLVPQVLKSLDFQGALLTTFDGTLAPPTTQARGAWLAADGSSLDAVWTTPIDTGVDATMLALADHIDRAMQYDHVATLVLAGWAGHHSPFYDDLRRGARFGPVLGRFVTLEEYFAHAPDPEYWTAAQVSVSEPKRERAPPAAPACSLATSAETYTAQSIDVHDRLLAGLAAVVADRPATELAAESRALDLEAIASAVLAAHAVGKTGGALESPAAESAQVAVNAWSFPRSVAAGTDQHNESALQCQSVPAMGYCWAAPRSISPVPLAVDNRLCNEHLEVVISPRTGGIQSFKSHGDRRTRASQRLVYVADLRTERRRLSDSPAGSSRMEVDRLEVVRSDASVGAILAQGRLMGSGPDQVVWATFEQRFTLALGAPYVMVEVTLDQIHPGATAPRGAYLASRLLWDDASARLRRGRNWLHQPADEPTITTADWVQIARQDGSASLSLYPLGLPRHERLGEKSLDTLLVREDGPASRLRFAVGLDDAYPLHSALAMLTPAAHCVTKVPFCGMGPSAAGAVGWFLHVRPRNVVVTWLDRLEQGHGIVMRVLETEGRRATVRISAWRPFAEGRRMTFDGRVVGSLAVESGQLVVEVDPYQWIQLEGLWNNGTDSDR